MQNSNPFQDIAERLDRIESAILVLKPEEKKASIQNNPDERLTRKELKEQFKLSYPTIHNLMKSGALPFEKVGRSTRFKRSDVEAYFSSKKSIHLN
ncbi:hypothetical protein C9994_10605 [Marivirga lumbricoides]|uniref:Helix-turn-helix domain-containing protein n=1 Tax=Marivirga lumbricoides TaxID=1046115 RepID=A0A2T4DPE7_9BACT|nr:hypothetical protein C9994_10605 [Marivirga lumbricoides]